MSGHKWADMSEGDYGVALLNDCKYGYDARENVLRLSLIRSPVHPFTASDIGKHRFSYALLPHAGGWREARVDAAGYAFNYPPVVSRCGESQEEGGDTLPETFSLLRTESATAMVEVLKQAENGDGLILRAFDSHGTHESVSFETVAGIDQAAETNLLEEGSTELDVDGGLRVRFSPYEIKTLRLRLRDIEGT